MDEPLLSDIESALQAMDKPELTGGYPPAVLASLRRQLTWCRDYVSGNRELSVMPGPFSMGLIATREFDMYGDQPELAGLINSIESRVNAHLRVRPV